MLVGEISGYHRGVVEDRCSVSLGECPDVSKVRSAFIFNSPGVLYARSIEYEGIIHSKRRGQVTYRHSAVSPKSWVVVLLTSQNFVRTCHR